MKLEGHDLMALSKVAIQAARDAGALIQDYAGTKMTVNQKDTGESLAAQVVTEVDLKSQDIILRHLYSTMEKYDLGLLAEELEDDGSRFQKDYFWCIDPIDGTLPFIKGEPGYAVSIALVSLEGKSVIGVVFDPYTQTLYHAVSGGGAFRNEQHWTLPARGESDYQRGGFGGAVMSACKALDNSPAAFLKRPKKAQGGGCAWDYAATSCIYKELGAWVSDASGNPLKLNDPKKLYMNTCGVLFTTHSDVAEDVLRRLEEEKNYG